jgi:hypothetical protein
VAEYSDIETALVDWLTALEFSQAPLFSRVRGGAFADRRSRVAALARETLPAALVALDGRARTDGDGVSGAARVALMLADHNLRSADGTRLGDVDGRGAFVLAQEVAAGLSGAVLGAVAPGAAWRFTQTEERIAAADERHIVVEQVWLADQPVTSSGPTFDGADLFGSDAFVAVEVEGPRVVANEFSFPGVDGVFQTGLGRAGRTVRLSGVLRAETPAALGDIEAGIEARVGDGRTALLDDGQGRTFATCVAARFERRGPRRFDAAGRRVVQGFALSFLELAD